MLILPLLSPAPLLNVACIRFILVLLCSAIAEMNTAGSRQILAALCPSPICCGSEAADRRWLSAVPPSFAAIGICYGVALIGRSHYRDQILARDDEMTCYDPVVTEPPWIGYCSYARYLRQRMYPGSANTEATSLLRQKRGEGGRPSAPVLLYSSNSIYRHCAACKAPLHPHGPMPRMA
jgi:hypothetical protein